MTPRLDWTYQTKVYSDPGNNPPALQPAYGLLDGRLSWNSPDGKRQTSLWFRTGQPGWPRTFMATFRRSF